MCSRSLVAIAFVAWSISLAALDAEPAGVDPSFGTNGTVLTDFKGGADTLWDLAVAPDGTLVAVGCARHDTSDFSCDFAVARYSADGQLMAAVTVEFHSPEYLMDTARRVAILPDGRILVAGVTASTEAIGLDVALVRLLPTLAPDRAFGTGGRVITPIGRFFSLYGLGLQPDGRAVVLLTEHLGLIRYNQDGSLDTTFGGGGGVDPALALPFAMAVQPDGRIVVVGLTVESPTGGMIRVLPNGAPDTSFGTNGRVAVEGGYDGYAQAVAVQPDGRILVAGHAGAGWPSDFALWRLEADGRLDLTFGSGGQVFTDLGAADYACDVAVQPDGRIVAVADSIRGEGSDFMLARYESNGALDHSFGPGGLAKTGWAFGSALVVQPGRGIVVAGQTANPASGTEDFALRRYDPQPANAPPVISPPVATPGVLWPPNHRLVEVTINYEVIDDSDPEPACVLSVTPNEPSMTRGRGHTAVDWEVLDAHRVRLRAERSVPSFGRTYTVAIACTDLGGLQAERHVTVTVPKSR
jgi:uncharacterized delta-60 repeat protein